MKILVVGAGALGGTIGALLSEAGQAVTLLEIDAARAALLNQDGLQLEQEGQKARSIPVRVVTKLDGVSRVDLAFVSVKSYQTESAVNSILPVLGPDSLVLSMQNGIGNTDRMAKLLGPERVVSGITYHSVQHLGSNHLRFKPGIKPIQIAPYQGKPTPAIEAVGKVFSSAGLDTEVIENIDHVVWQKLLHNAVVNPVSAITGFSCHQLLADFDLQQLMQGLCGEIVSVMQARGVPIVEPEDPYRPVLDSQKALGDNRPSMWQDLHRGIKTEIDALNGAVVEEAKRFGLDTKLNWMMVRLIHAIEKKPIH